MKKSYCALCEAEIPFGAEVCPHCQERLIWLEACHNCNHKWHEGDRYCRHCGAPKGTPEFIQTVNQYIYGPEQVYVTHACSECHFSWETSQLVNEESFCPLCGRKAPVVNREDDPYYNSPFRG